MAVSLQYLIYLPLIYNIGRYPIGYTGVGSIPKIGRASVWAPISGGGIHFESILTLPVLSALLNPRSYRGGISTLNLPALSILFCHRPTGGESYGLDNHLAA